MADSVAGQTGQEQTETKEESPETGGLSQLRALLVGPEQEQIRAIRSRLDDLKARTQDTSQVLPEAIALRSRDVQMNRALAPSIEQAISISVRRNPKPLADALFPVMGPAIRRAIAHALNAMVQTLNQSLELSLSWRSLRWRLVAWRTGRPFSEVVLLNTLLYRVEQVFLIHRETGLLLHHVTDPSVSASDPDMISGMLTAIRDFVRDSFGGADQESLEALQVGDLSVWVEQGPLAVLAAVVRGNAPVELRASLQEALETVHLELAGELDSFEGDAKAFEAARPFLEGCFQTGYRRKAEKTSAPWLRWALAAAAVLLLGIWGALYIRDQMRWNRYVDRLKLEPGILVIYTGRTGGRHLITGLRDPLAADPAAIARQANLAPESIEGRWEFYQALHPDLVLRRAKDVLRPPETVELSLDNAVLAASGHAPYRWILESRRLARLIPGVVGYDDVHLQDAELSELETQIESCSLRFSKGTAQLDPGQRDPLRKFLELLRRLDTAARESGLHPILEIIGHSDSDGSPETNLLLSEARAIVVRDLLLELKPAAIEIRARGVGSTDPPVESQSEEEKQKNRRVSFRVESGEAREDRPASR